MKAGFQITAGMFAFLAAAFWFISATVRVRYKDIPGPGGWIESDIKTGNTDFIRTVQRQSFWNARAALAACVAAVFQFIVIVL